MLCLLTYADIKAVNPEALTPWKAENIWQLYIGTANHCFARGRASARGRGRRSYEPSSHLWLRRRERSSKVFSKACRGGICARKRRAKFSARWRWRVTLTKIPCSWSLTRGRHWYELTLVTLDRPFLFAKMAGALAAWGMNIVKAAAFSNRAGIVVDTFLLHGPISHSGIESAGMGALQSQHSRCSDWARRIWIACCETGCARKRTRCRR